MADDRFENAEEIGSIARDGASVKVRRLAGEDVDIRVYVEGEKYTGPTKKGVLLAPGEVEQLVAILTG